MRHPLRSALLWLALLPPAALCFTVVSSGLDLPDWLRIAVGTVGGMLGLVGLINGVFDLLPAIGAWRLSRRIGLLAQWTVAPRDWNAFRDFDARRTDADPALRNTDIPRPAQASVEVLFGHAQALVDGAYHPLRRFGMPELRGVGWLQPEGAPEVLEFDLAYARGRSGGILPMTLRVPVSPTARDAAIRVHDHFKARMPTPRVGLAFRRPGLVIGWGIGLTLGCVAVAGAAWLLQDTGRHDEAMLVAMLVGLIAAIGSAVFTLIILLIVQPWRRQ